MNILNDNDLKKYMTKCEMYITKDIVNSNFKTEFEANRTYFIDGIDIEWVKEYNEWKEEQEQLTYAKSL